MRHIEITNPEELPGVTKKSFAMSYNGGEIWFEHLDGMYGYSELVRDKFMADFPSITKPSAPSLVAVNLDETLVTDELLELIVKSFCGNDRYVHKLVFVGLDSSDRRRFKRAFKLHGQTAHFAVAYINDFEKSKQWLVSDGAFVN